MQLPVTEFCDLVSFRLVMGYSDINDILDLFVFILETFDFFPQKIHTVYSWRYIESEFVKSSNFDGVKMFVLIMSTILIVSSVVIVW